MFCPKCGSKIEGENKFCFMCGSSVNRSEIGTNEIGSQYQNLGNNINSYRMPKQFIFGGFRERGSALLVDVLLLLLFFYLLSIVLSIIFPGQEAGYFFPLAEDSNNILMQLIGLIVPIFYFSLMNSSTKQATIGKQMHGLIVTDLEGKQIPFGKALVRELATILSAIFLFGYFVYFFSEKKQTLHDLMASTLVIKK